MIVVCVHISVKQILTLMTFMQVVLAVVLGMEDVSMEPHACVRRIGPVQIVPSVFAAPVYKEIVYLDFVSVTWAGKA